jgi:DNA-binding NtrC family response regulator
MKETIAALLVHDRAGHLFPLKQVLDAQRVKITEARTCEEAARELAKANPPHLVFTDTAVPDGTCLDVLALAAKAPRPVHVIVASRAADMRLYLDAMEHGAFDFITGSCLISELAYVLHNASENVVSLRQGHGRLSPESTAPSGSRKTLSWNRFV